jgi:hypothetical protein
MKGAKIQGYGNFVIIALDLYKKAPNEISLGVAWDKAVDDGGKSNKPCPKFAFLTLCKENLIKGIEKRAVNNIRTHIDQQTLQAVNRINFQAVDFSNYAALWRSLKISDQDNGRLSVIHALYEHDLLSL